MYDIFEKLNSRNRMYDIFEKTWIRQNRMYDIFGNSWHWSEPNVRYFSGLSQTSKTECTIFFRVRKSTHFVAFSDCAYHSNGFEKHSEGFITLFLANCFFFKHRSDFWQTQGKYGFGGCVTPKFVWKDLNSKILGLQHYQHILPRLWDRRCKLRG